MVDRISNVLGDRKEEVVMMPLLEKKPSTKDVDKGTYELADTPLLDNKSSKKYVDKGGRYEKVSGHNPQ